MNLILRIVTPPHKKILNDFLQTFHNSHRRLEKRQEIVRNTLKNRLNKRNPTTYRQHRRFPKRKPGLKHIENSLPAIQSVHFSSHQNTKMNERKHTHFTF
ncbi:hypothetical protein HanHA300_Chr03g0078601 [Helianthus annuus]|nr:hypothetical protein HanHA300_Chr03g0078601 [Helianthus annuus]KAJ0766930.1 hypothetical protein HanLR1_Chr03g0083251 [Helianthus annuus]